MTAAKKRANGKSIKRRRTSTTKPVVQPTRRSLIDDEMWVELERDIRRCMYDLHKRHVIAIRCRYFELADPYSYVVSYVTAVGGSVEPWDRWEMLWTHPGHHRGDACWFLEYSGFDKSGPRPITAEEMFKRIPCATITLGQEEFFAAEHMPDVFGALVAKHIEHDEEEEADNYDDMLDSDS
jgi:hypothetical protein